MSEHRNKRINKSNEATKAALGAAAFKTVERYGSAASEHIKGYQGEVSLDGKNVKGLKDIAKSASKSYKNTKQQAGFAGEVLYESRTNARNIIDNKPERIRSTDALGDTNHQEFDHVKTDIKGNPIINQHGNYTGTSQMKLRGHYDLKTYIKKNQQEDPNWQPPEGLTQDKLIKISAEENVKKLYNKDFNHYENVDFLDIPTEQYNHAKNFLNEKRENLMNEINTLEESGNIKTAQTKREQLQRVESVDKRLRDSVGSEDAMNARIHPKIQTAKEVHSVAHEAGKTQAKYGAIIGGSISLSQNIVNYYIEEEMDLKQLGLNVTKDTVGAAALSYGTGYSGTVIKSIMERSGEEVFRNLSKSNLPAMMATASLEVAKSIKRYLTEDDFDELQLIEELGEKGTGMMAASFGAAAGTAIFPGVGTVLGGMVGYMASSTIYRSAMDLLKEGNLSHENRVKVEQLTSETVEFIQQERNELSKLIDEHFSTRQEVFERTFEEIQSSIESGNHESFIQNINELSITFGVELKLANFDVFDDFMLDDSAVFKF